MVEGDGLPEIAKEQLSMWRIFLEKGDLPPDQQCEDGLMEFSSHCPIGALASTVIIPPREQRAVTFILSWFFPHHYDRPTRSGGFLGHHYAVRFPRGVMEVTGKTLPRYQELYQRSYAWRELFVETTLPAPVRDLILETLYLLPRITWWTAEDAFYILESVDCPRVSCSILNRYYVAVLSALFPDLYTRLLRATAEAQLPSGEIPSTLGVGSVRRHEYRIFNPGDVAIFPLAIYWQALWCGDRAFIAEFYPSLKRTLQWGATILDEDGDGVPDVHGIDQGWDTFPMYGCAAYIADQWLAALRAGAAMARLCHDQSFAAWCDEIFERASKTVEEKLWNGKYYDLSWQSATQMRSSICFTDQFTYGTVPAQLLGLGDIHPRERVQRALAAIWELNVRGAQFVCRAGSNPDGTPADCSYHAEQRGGASQSNCFSPVMVVPLACAALQYGQVKEGEQLLIDMAQRIIATMREPWSGKLLFDSRDGKWFYGIHYSDCLIIWEVLYAVLGLTLNVIERRLQFCPPAVPVRAPIFSRIFTGEVGISAARIELRNREEEPSYLRSITVTLPQGPRICFENVIIMPGSRWEMPLEV